MNQTEELAKNFVVYRSSAGSGKTFTLVFEFLKLALSSRNFKRYRSILAITFTNKAAAEMKSRIIDHLKGFAEGEDSPHFDKNMQMMLVDELRIDKGTLQERAAGTLEHMLHNYSDLSVSTIDRFVHRLIRSFSRDLELAPDFEVSMESAELLEEAVDRLLDRVGSEEELTQLLKGFVKSKIDDEKDWDISKDLEEIGNQIFKEDAIGYLDRLSVLGSKDFLKIKERLEKERKAHEMKVRSLAEKGLQIIDEKSISHKAFFHSEVPAYFKRCLNEVRQPGKRLVQSTEEDRWYSKSTDRAEKVLIDEVSSELSDILLSLFELSDADYTQGKSALRYNLLLAILQNIDAVAVIHEIQNEAVRLKEEKNLILIGDFNRLVSQVVKNNPAPFIYERIGEKFTNYLIDEFQDTSVLQWQNFLPLFHNALSRQNFTMLVGDAKQAIYRFRNGDVEQFAELPGLKGQEDDAFLTEYSMSLQRNFAARQLNTNYRSKAEIVSFNNMFYEALKTEEPSISEIYKSHSQKPKKDVGGYVRVEKFEAGDKQELIDKFIDGVLNTVEECLKDGFHQRDIAIITRANKEAVAISNALIAAEGKNYRVLSAESLVLENDPKVQLVISYMRWLMTPNDRSCQVKLAEWISIKIYDKVDPDFVLDLLAENDFSGKILSKSGSRMEAVVEHQASLTPYELIESVIRQFDLLKEVNVFLEFLLDTAFSYARKRDNSIHGFLQWWDEKGRTSSIKVAEGTDAINVLTIHKSKGLQFPVVIFPFASLEVKYDHDHWVRLNEPELPASYLRLKSDRTTPFHHVHEEEKSKALLDHINMFYVATTRPKDRLYVMYGSRKNGDITKLIDQILLDKINSEGVFELGEAKKLTESKVKVDKASQLEKELEHVNSFDYRNKLKISYQAPFAWQVEAPEQDREFGNKLHRIMALLKFSEDADKAFEQAMKEGWISESELPEVRSLTNTLFTDSITADWFSGNWQVFTEVDLLSASGVVLRPDRIQYDRDRCLVIDYKTGLLSPAHQKQMSRYVREVSSILQREAEGYLIYFSPWQVVKV